MAGSGFITIRAKEFPMAFKPGEKPTTIGSHRQQALPHNVLRVRPPHGTTGDSQKDILLRLERIEKTLLEIGKALMENGDFAYASTNSHLYLIEDEIRKLRR